MAERGRLLVRCEVAANERKGDRGLLARDEHVERLDSECAALAVCAVDDRTASRTRSPWRSASTAIDESSREVALVLQRPSQRAVGSGERRAGSERAGSVRGGVVEHLVEEVRRHDAGAVRRIQRVERCEHDHAVAVAERGLDDRQAVLRRRIGGCADQRRAPRRSLAGERGCEERDGCVAEPPDRGGRAARGTGLLERCDDAARRSPCSSASSGTTASSAAARTVGSASSRSATSMLWPAVTIRARAEGGRRRAPLGGVGGAGEVGRQALGRLRGGPSVPAGSELDECPHAHLGIRVLRRLPERAGGSRRRDRPAAGRGRGARHAHRRT